MQQAEKQSGKRTIFFSGMLVGGLIGAVSVFLFAAPSGKKVIKKVQQEGISLKGKSTNLMEAAMQKSVALKNTIQREGHGELLRTQSEQMIPIPKDYVTQ
ncbi:MAG: hypothetical protein ACE3JK_11295 [Sporolactobacillus sp.]